MHRARHSQKHAPNLPFPFPRGSTNKSPSSARAASCQSPVARTCPRRPTSERRTRSTGTASLESPRPQARVLTLTLRLTLTLTCVPVPVPVPVHVPVRFLGTSDAPPHHPCAIRASSAHPPICPWHQDGSVEDSRAACAHVHIAPLHHCTVHRAVVHVTRLRSSNSRHKHPDSDSAPSAVARYQDAAGGLVGDPRQRRDWQRESRGPRGHETPPRCPSALRATETRKKQRAASGECGRACQRWRAA